MTHAKHSKHYYFRVVLITALLLVISAIGIEQTPAQDADGGGQERTPASQPAAADGEDPGNEAQDQQSARQELEAAYQQEFAFLVAQKRELQARIETFRGETETEVSQTRQRIDELQQAALSLDTDAKALQQQVNGVERRRETARQNASVLSATFQQAAATFGEYRMDFMNRQSFADRNDADKLAAVYAGARALLSDLTSVRTEPGAFYSLDGGKVDGTLIRVGDIATYGVGANVAGALAPAGGGELKVWEQPAAEDARALAAGQLPDQLGIFIYESLANAVSGEQGEGVVAYINSGGIIAWIIVGLGAVAALLILVRTILLMLASTSTKRIVKKVQDKMRARDVDGAIALCKRRKSAAAAVAATALRNMHRERAQLEDTVDEAILHENARLDRCGQLILIIAAVSPLLGLLGTVTGMISTFDVITEFGTGDPQLLSGGISIALITTELGLIVAIPALLIGNMLSGWASRIKDDMHKAALRITNLYEDFEGLPVPRAA